jgi:hypothetical protein
MFQKTIPILLTGYYKMNIFIQKTILNINKLSLNTLIYFLPHSLVSKILTLLKIEPAIDDWISISTVKKDILHKKYVLQENYYFNYMKNNYATCKNMLLFLPFSQFAIANECNINYSVETNNTKKHTNIEKEFSIILRNEKKNAVYLKKTQELVGSLIIKKGNNKFILNHLLSQSSIRDLSNIEKTNVEILDVIYKNTKMSSSSSSSSSSHQNIIIDLPKSSLLVGNDILSNVYILRYLKYKNMEKYFNENYELDILLISPSNNNEIETINLNYNQYIKLYKNAYVIK